MTSRNSDRGRDSRCSLRCLLPHSYVCLSFLEENTLASSASSKDNQMIARLRKVTRIKICARVCVCVCERKHRLIVLPLGFLLTSHLSRHFSSFFLLYRHEILFFMKALTSIDGLRRVLLLGLVDRKKTLLAMRVNNRASGGGDGCWVERVHVYIRTKRSEKE